MSVRERLERWFVGDAPGDADGEHAVAAPSTALELARVGEMADAIRMHLSSQEAERTEILRVLASLSDPLAALPRMAAQQDRLGETITQALTHARQRDSQLDATLSRIVDGIGQQTEVAGLIQQQLDLNLQAANGVAEGTTRLTEAVTELASSSRRSTDLLASLVEEAKAMSVSGAQARKAAQRWMIAVIALGTATAVLAIVVALISMRR